jgi:hypothetical protein
VANVRALIELELVGVGVTEKEEEISNLISG